MSRRIKLTISGKAVGTDAPTVEDVLDQIRDYHDILKGVEEALAEDGRRRIQWRIVNASRSSPLCFEFEAFSSDFGADIVETIERVTTNTAEGMRALEIHDNRPSYFDDEVLAKTEFFFERVTNGLDQVVLDYGDHLPKLFVTSQVAGAAVKNIQKVLAPASSPYVEMGSIEVFVLGVGVDGRGKRLLFVRSRLNGDDFKCTVSDEAAEEIQARQIGEVWQNLRAELTGRIHFKTVGRISKVDALSIRFFRNQSELPDLADIQDKNFTGGRKSEEYLEGVRSGELS